MIGSTLRRAVAVRAGVDLDGGHVIRAFEQDDAAQVVDLVVEAEMFSSEEAPFLVQMLAAYQKASEDDGHVCIVDEDEAGVLAVAYYQPKIAADRVWDLTMIAVRPRRQGHGVGGALLRHVEHDLRGRGQRLLLVETSGTSQYDRTREFYARCGYVEEARVRDYWTDGDDLVLFVKRTDAPDGGDPGSGEVPEVSPRGGGLVGSDQLAGVDSDG